MRWSQVHASSYKINKHQECDAAAQLCPVVCNLRDCRAPGASILRSLPHLLKFAPIESVMLPDHLISAAPFLLPSVFPRIRSFPMSRLPLRLSCKELAQQCRRCGFSPWFRKIPWRRKWLPTPVFSPGKSHGQRSLVGQSPWDCKEFDTTERLHFFIYCPE